MFGALGRFYRRQIPIRRMTSLRAVAPGRAFSTSNTTLAQPLPPRPSLPEAELVESFLKGSGPGGQKINKTNCAVQLTHVPTGLQVKCQATRSRTQNRKVARRILAERVEELRLGADSRTALKRERESKKRASQSKKSARKYRALDAAKVDGVSENEDGTDVEALNEELQSTPEVQLKSDHLTSSKGSNSASAQAVGMSDTEDSAQDKVKSLLEEAQTRLQQAKRRQ